MRFRDSLWCHPMLEESSTIVVVCCSFSPQFSLGSCPVALCSLAVTLRHSLHSGVEVSDEDHAQGSKVRTEAGRLGGDNGTTLSAGIHTNVNNISWETKDGVQHPDPFGSVTQASTVYVGTCDREELCVPLKELAPMIDPSGIVFGDSANQGDAMKRSKVVDIDLQKCSMNT